MPSNSRKIIFLTFVSGVLFGVTSIFQACQKSNVAFNSLSSKGTQLQLPLSQLEDESNGVSLVETEGGNGNPYDGKLIRYQSLDAEFCRAKGLTQEVIAHEIQFKAQNYYLVKSDCEYIPEVVLDPDEISISEMDNSLLTYNNLSFLKSATGEETSVGGRGVDGAAGADGVAGTDGVSVQAPVVQSKTEILLCKTNALSLSRQEVIVSRVSATTVNIKATDFTKNLTLEADVPNARGSLGGLYTQYSYLDRARNVQVQALFGSLTSTWTLYTVGGLQVLSGSGSCVGSGE